MAARRKSLNESLQDEPEITPEMEAFRKGITTARSQEDQAETRTSATNDLTSASRPQQSFKNFSMKLEEDLYDSFSRVCFNRKQKMAKVVRHLIEQYVEEDARSSN